LCKIHENFKHYKVIWKDLCDYLRKIQDNFNHYKDIFTNKVSQWQ